MLVAIHDYTDTSIVAKRPGISRTTPDFYGRTFSTPIVPAFGVYAPRKLQLRKKSTFDIGRARINTAIKGDSSYSRCNRNVWGVGGYAFLENLSNFPCSVIEFGAIRPRDLQPHV